MRLIKAFLLALLIFTLLSFPLQEKALRTSTSGVVSNEKGFVLPSAGVLRVTTNAGMGANYSVSFYDPERNGFLLNETPKGQLNGYLKIKHAGYYFAQINSYYAPVTLAYRMTSKYPSRRILEIKYFTGGTSAIILALLLFREGRR
ncbi:hypothetical membrane protein [Thermococcus kodakarensis KOD1]|uniref:Hypothetical membrane protein n=1 Tax=Thermococcus kodakarensis (strain ATCC BAA-918 / JCM 12380 / KOD1) TaxID=69014 RepID=Q5JFI7_THEKO|nr:hypothetical protein [Thermococcus kodakarensis]WCN28262.1 hypothetical protein POG15_00835 [Thermococcus kodakarensis]WCN30557.1 hypothetical protein POG21_00835 [Thermococcus kodakarensis]BAD84351.1 hypothetical membrane protein [Thermococcus kodakarensis KOD1]